MSLMKLIQELKKNCGTGAGGFEAGNTCAAGGGGGGEREKDSRGRTVIPDAVAGEGADIADAVAQESNNFDGANQRLSDVKYSKLKRDKKLVPERQAAFDLASKKYGEAQDKADAFKGKHGISAVDAWEAKHDRGWPDYKVDTRANKSPKFTTESKKK